MVSEPDLNMFFISATLNLYQYTQNPTCYNTKLTTIILTGNNYIPWARSVTIGLGGKDKLSFVTSTKAKPVPAKVNEAIAEEKIKIDEWETIDKMIMSWLLSTMEPRISNTLMYYVTSKDIWDKKMVWPTKQKNGIANKSISHTFLTSNKILQESNKMAKATTNL
jgi:gag-polypeptide of LTR copia-type